MSRSRIQGSPPVGLVMVTVGAVLWGTGGVAGAIITANSDASWLGVSAIRLLVGGLLMIAITLATGQFQRVPRTRESARQIVITGVLTAVCGAAFFQSVQYAGVAVATTLTLGATPLTVTLYMSIRSRTLPGRRAVLALVVAIVGLVLVCDLAGAHPGANSLAGAALALFSGVAFAGTTVLNRRPAPGLPAGPLLAASFTLAGLLSLTWGLPAGLHLETFDAEAWVALGALVLLQTVLGYFLYYGGLQRGVSATTAAILTLLEPVAAAVLAYALLGQELTLMTAVGIVLLLVGVLLVVAPAPPRLGRRAK